MERWIEEITAERHQEWLRKGIEAGRKEATVSLTIRLLTRKFGRLDTALEERVEILTLEQLETLGEDLLDFRAPSALTEWLDRTEKSR